MQVAQIGIEESTRFSGLGEDDFRIFDRRHDVENAGSSDSGLTRPPLA